MKSNTRKILVIVIVIAVLAAAGFGCWYFLGRSSGEAVNVYNFQYIGMTEYWGDSMESYGPVTTDNIQTVFLTATQTVTDILVAPGDTVKKGDLLMTFDTTLTDISLERQRLRLEKMKLDLEDAQAELVRINQLRPSVPQEPVAPPEPDLGVPLAGPYEIIGDAHHNGSSPETYLICWFTSETPLDEALLDALRAVAGQYQQPSLPDDTEPPEEDPTQPTDAETTVPSDPTTPTEPEVPSPVLPEQFHVVLKITQGNLSYASATMWQGLSVSRSPETGAYRMRFFDASGFQDFTLPPPEEPAPLPDTGSGFTASEIAQMRIQQEKAIRDLQFQLKMAETDYKIMQAEMGDGNVYAQIDGTVVSVLSPEEALMNMEPVLKVSSGGGFYVSCSVSELQKDALLVGQEVTVNDWSTGMTYTGTVQSVSDYPAPDDGGMYGNGNPNVSMYPFTVFIDDTADLQAGSYVSVIYSTATAESGVYLENPFLRTENGQSYVYIRGEDGLLEKRYVVTGKSLWGSYTQILEGVTAEDFLAFPYGKHLRPGAQTLESDISELYQY